MPWIIRNAAGEICGHATNKPGDGNTLPDGSEEIHQFYEDDPNDKAYDAGAVAEVQAFVDAQAAKIAVIGKRAAALKAIDDQRLVEAAKADDAPQAVKDYAEAVAARDVTFDTPTLDINIKGG